VATGAFTADPGAYEVLVARSAEHIVRTAPLTVTGTAPAPRVVVGRRTWAADFDDHTDITLVDATRTAGDAVAPADPAHPATLLFKSVDLSGVIRFGAEVAREGTGPDEVRLEVRAGDRLVAEPAPPVTGSRHTWTTVTVDATAPGERRAA
jgi:beta-glucosidase